MFAAITCSESFALMRVAREFSPRIESWAGGQELVLDLSGLARLFGDTETIAEEIRRTAEAGSVQVRVAIAATRAGARLLVRYRAGVTVVAPGGDAAAIAPVPIDLLSSLYADGNGHDPREMDPGEMVVTLKRWGLRTLGAFAALPPDDVAARLGQRGVRWQRVARGEDLEPLVPVVPEERFEQSLELEWPIEGLEPLSFVLGRLLDPLSVQLERRDRGAARIHLQLRLVTRQEHVRSLELPIPMRDARTLRTLLLLDLESHPPEAAIDRVTVTIDPTPGRVVQFSLLTRPLPSPEQVSTLMARLHALMGESRCGSPGLVDSWEPGAFVMTPFQPRDEGTAATSADDRATDVRHADAWDDETSGESSRPVMALRRFRHPVIARVRVENGKPSRVTTDRTGLAGGRVESCAGPWRTSGGWWERQGRAGCEVRGAAGSSGFEGAAVRGSDGAVRSVDDATAHLTFSAADAVVRSGGCSGGWQGTDAAVRSVGGREMKRSAAFGGRGAGSGTGTEVRGFEGSTDRGPGRAGCEVRGAAGGSGFDGATVRRNDGAVREFEGSRVQQDSGMAARRKATVSWDRDEWDVTLSDGATYRIFRERGPERWFVEGIVD